MTVCYAGRGSSLLIAGREISQVQSIMIDHANARLRARIIHREDDLIQAELRSMSLGGTVTISLLFGESILNGVARLRLCRTRIDPRNAIRTTVEFEFLETKITCLPST